MATKHIFQTSLYTFNENVESGTLNLAELALNKLLFLNKEDYLNNNINESDISQVKITIQVEKL